MENRILVVGYDRAAFGAAQREWLKYDVLLHMVDTVAEAIVQLSRRDYLAVAVSSATPDLSPPLLIMREVKPVPIVVLSPEDRAATRAGVLFAGADAFIDPSRTEEGVAEGRAVIERYKNLPPHEGAPVNVLSHEDIFMAVELHKVFVRGREVRLTKAEMSALHLLLSQAGRVFAHEQIYRHIYDDDAPRVCMVNAVHCHIKRMRRKLRVEGASDCIDSVRGIGYRMVVS
jgi:two-component system KDP operon response regulator KdpE